jgi:hypothetical protein
MSFVCFSEQTTIISTNINHLFFVMKGSVFYLRQELNFWTVFDGSLESGGRFCVGTFGSYLASVAVKTFPHVTL